MTVVYEKIAYRNLNGTYDTEEELLQHVSSNNEYYEKLYYKGGLLKLVEDYDKDGLSMFTYYKEPSEDNQQILRAYSDNTYIEIVEITRYGQYFIEKKEVYDKGVLESKTQNLYNNHYDTSYDNYNNLICYQHVGYWEKAEPAENEKYLERPNYFIYDAEGKPTGFYDQNEGMGGRTLSIEQFSSKHPGFFVKYPYYKDGTFLPELGSNVWPPITPFSGTKPFLTAEWRKLAMANYAVNPAVLQKYLPHHTELDFFNGVCYVSLVGFMFANTKLKGVTIPFHKNFEEVNLRFYVRHKDRVTGKWKRGVVFVKEIVPKHMLTFVANTLYKEHYQTMPMEHDWKTDGDELTVTYQWHSKHQNSFSVVADKTPLQLQARTEAEFITEHYWGYTRVNNEKTLEYKVEHPSWDIYDVKQYDVTADFGELYGADFSFLNDENPVSVLLAEGSEMRLLNAKRV
jgi:uncharacterized protein